jgi:hypothetical protein
MPYSAFGFKDEVVVMVELCHFSCLLSPIIIEYRAYGPAFHSSFTRPPAILPGTSVVLGVLKVHVV